MLRFLAFLALICLCNAGCPGPIELKKMLDGDACGILYMDDICTGGQRNVNNNGLIPNLKGSGFNDEITSLQVRPGCELHAFQHKNYGGKKHTFTYQENGHFDLRNDGMNDMISSVQCLCESWIDCKPTDKDIILESFSVEKSYNQSLKVKYEYFEGTEDTETVTSGSQSTTTLKYEIGLTLANIFSESLSLSQEWKTWQQTTHTTTFQTTRKMYFDIEVPPGKTVTIKQRVASCGKYSVKGQALKLTEENNDKQSRANRIQIGF